MILRKVGAAILACLFLCGCVYFPAPETADSHESTNFRSEQSSTAAENTESVAAGLSDEEFVPIVDYIPTAVADLKYATEDNFTGEVIYAFTDAYARYGTVKKLTKASQALNALGYGLRIWDAYRPLTAQRRLWDICPDPAYVSHPETGGRSHCRGSAVDLTLYRLDTGEELEMPTGFDDFTALADRDYSDCTEEAAKNAQLLESVMIAAGFKPYSAEWSHYSDETDYPVEESFTP